MKTEMRRALAQESFEEKIRKVGKLIRLSAAVKAPRVRDEDGLTAAAAYRADARARSPKHR